MDVQADLKSPVVIGVESSIDDQPTLTKYWTDEEERVVVRKIDLTLLPIMALAFFALQVDRGNIANALTSTITKDLGITTNQINVGSQLLSTGIVLLEIPSNIMLQRIGPRKWLSFQIIFWSLVATLQAFIKNYPEYLVTRLLLGMLESGYIPGSLYYLSTWYKTGETAFRTSIFFYGLCLAAGTSSLIGAGLISLAGKGGLAGWQWLFLVEGAIGLGLGVIYIMCIPPAVGNGQPLFSFGRWSYYTERESQIMRDRILLDDPEKANARVKITGRDILHTLKQKRIWLHLWITLAANSAFTGLATYVPTLIKLQGHSAVKANELASVPTFVNIIWMSILAYLADRGYRGSVIIFNSTWQLIAISCTAALYSTSSHHTQLALIYVCGLPYATTHILNVSWLMVNCRTPQERSIALALIIMFANASGIAAGQIFRADDAPKYRRGMTIEAAIAAFSWLLVIIQAAQYYYNSRKQKKVLPAGSESDEKTV